MICNWGILGPGSITTGALIPAIQRSRNGRVRAIASRDQARAQTVAAQWDIERAYGDYQALLADPGIDAVYIALPNSLHSIWTIHAARAGKHVLCEKPLACSAREGAAMLDACQEAGVQLMEAAMYRFHPRMLRLCTAPFRFHSTTPRTIVISRPTVVVRCWMWAAIVSTRSAG